jgi:uncharacterized phage-associated protein
MVKAIDASKYLLALSEPNKGDLISNLKLQKLLYYSQGISLALYDCKLFQDDLVAWQHGPVVERVYDCFNHFKDSSISTEEYPVEDITIYSDTEQEAMSIASKEFGQYSAWKLVEMTHNERPWKETERNEVISVNLMKSYFDTLVVSN